MRKNDIISWIYSTPKERGHILVLLIVIVLAMALRTIVDHYYHPQVKLTAAEMSRLEKWLTKHARESETASLDSMFYFDPNRVSKSELITMGISERVADNWINFRAKGKVYSSIEDLRSIYGLQAVVLDRIAPYVNFPKAQQSTTKSQSIVKTNVRQEKELQLRHFDPNNIPQDSLLAWGVPLQLSAQLVNYREAGGRYRTPQDLKKLYAMTDSLYGRIAPYVQISAAMAASRAPQVADNKTRQSKDIASPTSNENIEKTVKKIDLNTADTVILKTLPGIGSKLARRIIRFREALGGFDRIEQLYEVYYLDSATVDRVRPRLLVHQSPQLRLAKQMSYRDFCQHPYLRGDAKACKIIYNYFRHHPQTASELVQLQQKVPTSIHRTLQVMKPYLVH